MSDFEAQWAVALKKTKTTSKIPLNTKQENVLDQIKYNKARLKEALKNKNKNQSWTIYKKLVQLRARLFTLKLQQSKTKNLSLNESTVAEALHAYIQDCKRLAQAINLSLKR